MSDFRGCIAKGVASGHMTPDQASKADDLYQGYLDDFEKTMPEGEAKRKAGQSAFTALEAEAAHRRRQLRLSETVAARITKDLTQYRDLKGRANKGEAMAAHMSFDSIGSFSNIETRFAQVRGDAMRLINEMVLNFQRDLLGRTPHKIQLDNMSDELFGTKTGDIRAKAFADAWNKTAENLRLRFNAAGGAIGKLENWGLPTSHNARVLRRSTYTQWRDFILPLIDRSKMIDDLTGQPLSGARLDHALRGVYDAVTSEGWSKRTPSRAPTGASIANRRGKERFIAWKDGASWRTYQKKFGDADAFHVMMNHIDGMSRDIAAMEILGPNPAATLRWMGDVVKKDAAQGPLNLTKGTAQAQKAKAREKKINRAKRQIAFTEKMWGLYTGESRLPAFVKSAEIGSGIRNYLTGTQLGSTTLLAVPTDIANTANAAKFIGMSQTRTLRRSMKMLNPLNKADREFAVRAGLIADHASQMGLAQMRYVGEVAGPQLTRQFADTMLRITGLSPWTQSARWAFGMEFMGHLADHTGKSLADLPEGLRRVLNRYGLDTAWDEIRRAPITSRASGRFLVPDSIAKIEGMTPSRSNNLSVRLLEMIQSETEFAVPTASLRGRAVISSTEKAGTVMGEISRSFSMYKSFPATIQQLHMRRAMAEGQLEGRVAGMRYFGRVIAYGAVSGALAIQLGEIAKGRDPKPMASKDFWAAAVLRSGGLGIYADFLTSENNRYGDGLSGTIAGPVAGLGAQSLGLTVGNLRDAAIGEDIDFGADLVKFLGDNAPGGRIWYTRLVFDRVIADQLQMAVSPKARQKFRRKMRRARRQNGQDYFWAPGQLTPSRAPDLGAALEPAPQ